MPINFSSVKNIAVVCRSAFGDLIMNDTLMQYCRQQAPKASITLFVDQQNAALLPFLRHYDEAVVMPNRGNKYLYLLRYALKYHSRQFDMVIISKGSPSRMLNLFACLLGAKQRIAYVNDNWHGRLINKSQRFDPNVPGTRHHALELLQLVDSSIHSVPPSLYPKLFVPQQQSNFIDVQAGKTLLVSVSNNRDYCLLDADRYAAAINAQQPSFKVVISAMKQDEAKAEQLKAKLTVPAEVVVTADVNTFVELLNQVDACFVGEGGIMHMAAALNKPQFVLFGRTLPTAWMPLSDKVLHLFHQEDVKQLELQSITEKLTELFKRFL